MCKGSMNSASDRSGSSLLLVFASTNDLSAIKLAVEVGGEDVSASGTWYCRLYGPNKMAYAQRTPLMIAAVYGSLDIINYILHCAPQKVNVNQPSESDGATALHLAASGGSPFSLEAVKILIDAGADIYAVDGLGRRPGEMIAKPTGRALEGVLKGVVSRASSPAAGEEKKKEYPPDLTLPDINSGVYVSDEFRMYHFKIKPCSRAYSHDWTECPFVHPGENARRRDPRKYNYSCVPCQEHRRGSTCKMGDNCEYAHGVFECWLHPSQYRTRLCKDVQDCKRRVCFFAHREDELRAVNINNGLVLSPRSNNAGLSSLDFMMSPSSMSPSAGLWMNQATTPKLQLPNSNGRLMMNAVDFDLIDYELQNMMAAASPRANWGSKASGLDYGGNLFGGASPGALNSSSASSMAKAIMNSRSSAFANRSQSFIDRGAVPRQPSGFSASPTGMAPSREVDWGAEREELNLLRKSASFAYRNRQPISPPKRTASAAVAAVEEPDFSWVHSLVRDGPAVGQMVI